MLRFFFPSACFLRATLPNPPQCSQLFVPPLTSSSTPTPPASLLLPTSKIAMCLRLIHPLGLTVINDRLMMCTSP